MALNISPRRQPGTASTPVIEEAPPVEAATEQAEASTSRTTTRGRRGTRSRGGATRGERAPQSAEAATADTDRPEPEASSSRRSRSRAKATDSEDGTADSAAEPARQPASRRRRTTARATEQDEDEGAAATSSPADEMARQRRTIDRLARDIDELRKLQRELMERADGKPTTQLQRVGVFVDVANVELATDKLTRRLDWSKVLKKLTKDRHLVRAVAYSPVHEDINVSLESQRFTEPFVDRGYRLVTKPLKKFSDGTVKANVDIEMTIEIMSMLDRLDIVCLVSGDGDFEPLVRTIQAKGVRVEIVSVGAATAMALKRAGDRFIDLATILSEVGV
jgi:uncharacterized LabA/DUF88 family protein